MKIRNGFVSNSSSSSFVLITTVKNHERAVKKVLEEDEYNLIPRIFDNIKTQIFNNEEVVIINGGQHDSNIVYGGLDSWYVEDLCVDDEDVYEFMQRVATPLWQKYISYLKDYIEHREDH